ncbi:hypothetical protein [Enterobacter sp. Bisph1]|uniref:hypothetical protein n=1 Tax=Enterobacter sp. Bisph1 TaxID=1274399 RepID=UPI00057C09E9|nr:hypothetical protein [Enterobacter sp. Bisph1]
MYNLLKIFLVSLMLFSLASCSLSRPVNKTLSPPSDTKWVSIEIKNPSPYTKPFPLEARYISYSCQKKRISGFDGSIITEPSYNVISIPMQQEGEVWKAKAAMTGGGSCKWSLSAMTLGIEYVEVTHIGKDLVPGTAVGAKLAFDNDASRNGQYTLTRGDLKLSPKYFPYLREKKIGKRENTLSLLGKEDFLSLRVYDLHKFVFSPELNEKKIVKFMGVEKKGNGAYPQIIYPDGSVAPARTLFPDFDKVDKMILK